MKSEFLSSENDFQVFSKTTVKTGCSWVNAMDVDQNKATYAIGCSNGMAKVWDTKTNRLKQVLYNLPEGQWLSFNAEKSTIQSSDNAKEWIDVFPTPEVAR